VEEKKELEDAEAAAAEFMEVEAASEKGDLFI
jgi:hypothetical protein